jgi:modulator of FtsH protease HflC
MESDMRKKFIRVLIILFVLTSPLWFIYTIDTSEYGVLTQFGKPLKVIKESGLHFKLPFFIHSVTKFSNRLLVYDSPEYEFLTKDKKNVTVTAYLLWKIDDPLLFLQTVYNRIGAESRLSDVISSVIGAALGNIEFSSLLSTEKEKVKFHEMSSMITKECKETAIKNYGIDVKDFRLKRFNFPQQNKESVFERMRSERGRIAKKFRSEGEEEGIKIKAEAENQKNNILAEANEKAAIIKGEGEAEATKIFAENLQKDPDFYKFLKTIETYEKIINDKTTVIIPSDSELMKLFFDGVNKQ